MCENDRNKEDLVDDEADSDIKYSTSVAILLSTALAVLIGIPVSIVTDSVLMTLFAMLCGGLYAFSASRHYDD